MTRPAELRRGARGEAVRDLQQRLVAAGHDVTPDDPGCFDVGTETAVRDFQGARGLRVDGSCGRQTWSAIVESGFALGDRLLYERRPMLRGDDVLNLQQRLNSLGFDAGREDGILGPETAAALREFQRNAGLGTDGIGGPSSIDALRRLGSLSAGSVAAVREREELRRPGAVRDRRIYLSAAPELVALGDLVARGLGEAGALPLLDATGAEDSALAAEANRFGAHVFLALRPGSEAGCQCAYFATPTFRSEAGYRIATALHEELGALLPAAPACGKTYAVLRETRMAAVVCEPVDRRDVAGMRALVARAGDIGRAIVNGIRRGIEEPPPDELQRPEMTTL